MQRLLCRTRPPLGCLLLMLLLVLGRIILSCSDLVLHLETLKHIGDGHRLFTHVFCTNDIQLLLLSLFLFPLLFWGMEERLGTLQFLQSSCLYTLSSAILYLLMSFLLPLPAVPASGYISTQVALLIANHKTVTWRFGKTISFFLPYGIFIITQLLFPESSLLFYICGVVSGLAARAGLFRHLELPVTRRQALDSTQLCNCLASFHMTRFIPTQEEDTLTYDTVQERLPFSYTDAYDSVLSRDVPIGGANVHNSNVINLGETPVWLGASVSLEDEMLEAGILASLREYEEQKHLNQEPTLNKSSVSALRLQQLERMGFPTAPAVVALAATGKVERAVSLLVEGEIGEDITVAYESTSSRGQLNSNTST